MIRYSLSDDINREIAIGFRPRSWALPLLLTFTPSLQEIAIGPFFLSRELYLPF